MNPSDIRRAEALLRDAPGRSMLLDALHAQLFAAAAGSVPSTATLASALALDARFLLLNDPDPFDALPLVWDGDTRDRYRAALRTAGSSTPRVALRDPPDTPADTSPEDAITLLDASLRHIHAASDPPGLADRLAEARAEYGAIVRLVPPQAGL